MRAGFRLRQPLDHRFATKLLGGFFLLGMSVLSFEAYRMKTRAKGKLFDEAELLPDCKVALVLGCVPVLPNGRTNLYFSNRIEAAAKLFHLGKVRYLLVSGDNHRRGYDEPTAMRDALIARAVPRERIVLDYAGFRTLDSIARAKDVFGQSHVIIVSQRFHNERALYLAQALGLFGVAYNAKDVPGARGDVTFMREPLARLRAVLDVRVLHTRPKYEGVRVEIGRGDESPQ